MAYSPVAQKPMHPHAHAERLSAIDAHLSENAAAECGEGGEETLLPGYLLTDSLESMRRAKQPGSDGIPYQALFLVFPVHLRSHTEHVTFTPQKPRQFASLWLLLMNAAANVLTTIAVIGGERTTDFHPEIPYLLIEVELCSL
jgi:hypothetical protein